MTRRVTIVDLGNGRLILEQGKHRIAVNKAQLARYIATPGKVSTAKAKALFAQHPDRWEALPPSVQLTLRRLDPHRAQAVIDAIRAGETYKAAGRRIGVTEDNAYQIAKKVAAKGATLRSIKDLALKRKWYPTRLDLVASYDDSSNVRLAHALWQMRRGDAPYNRTTAHRWVLKLIHARPKTALGAALALLEFRWQDVEAGIKYSAGGAAKERAEQIWRVWCEWSGRRRRGR